MVSNYLLTSYIGKCIDSKKKDNRSENVCMHRIYYAWRNKNITIKINSVILKKIISFYLTFSTFNALLTLKYGDDIMFLKID